ncbi:hypothetical protein F66182_7077 [Fusarium sp. NRRL 66182]|nr:hypothetical protein F66182_7077 [Fusarium sp. NRRL 66182]
MALPPKFAGQKLQFSHPASSDSDSDSDSDSAIAQTTHTLELYLDYCCPFSAKLFRTLRSDVIPAIRANEAWARNLTFIFRQQIQPWHPSSTLMHEAGLAVLRLAPERFWDFSAALFDEQSSFFDVSVVNETRNHTYRRLAKIARKTGLDEDRVYQLLQIPDKPAEDGALNAGNQVTNDVKVMTRMNRLIGVHVTPTAVYDGVVQDIEDELKRQARATSKGSKEHELPERLIIYHAGTGRTTFMAMLKITTLFMGAFFCFIVAPSYIKAGKPELETASIVLCGIIPIFFVAYTTSPFVTHIHMHIPPYARASRAILERFIKTLPPTTPLTLTTMSAISKPRYSHVQAGDLRPVRRRFGLINHVRDTNEENAKRRWYMFRAVGKFYVQDKRPQAKVRYQNKTDKVDGWIWDAVKERIDKRAQRPASV